MIYRNIIYIYIYIISISICLMVKTHTLWLFNIANWKPWPTKPPKKNKKVGKLNVFWRETSSKFHPDYTLFSIYFWVATILSHLQTWFSRERKTNFWMFSMFKIKGIK